MTNLIQNLKNKLNDNILNYYGWKTNRKLIIIESDDWGTIRMPNKSVFEKTKKFGINIEKCPFNNFDTLEDYSDLDMLFSLLRKYKDSNGNHPVITANTIMANPDFDRIRNDNFTKYYHESFTSTFKNYYPNNNVFSYWQDGVKEKLFFPQLHGREHLNVNLWMKFLRLNSRETMFAFNNRFFGISTNITNEKRKSYLAALDFESSAEIQCQKDILREAMEMFIDVFSFSSHTFIPPNYTMNSDLNYYLKEIGVSVIQGGKIQNEPIDLNGPVKVKRYLGELTKAGLINLVRNVHFEPSIEKNVNWLKQSMSQIENAFFWKKPAIISTHRLNFIGGLKENNRSENLKIFEKLISGILIRWPEVEFMSSDELSKIILEEKNEKQ